MSQANIWDSDDQDAFSEGSCKPLFTVEDLNDEEEVLKWVNNTYVTELKRAMPYRERAMKHVGLYKGQFYGQSSNTDSRSGLAAGNLSGLGVQSTKTSKTVVNHLFDLVNQRVARVLRNPAGVDIKPANSEYGDKLAAKVVKQWVDFIFYRLNIDAIRARVAKAAFIMGEAYGWVRWDPNGGDIHPEWKEQEEVAAKENRPPRLPLRDEHGKPVTSEDGEQLYVEKPVRVGEVDVKVCHPLNTLVQFTGEFEQCTYFFHEEFQDLDELKALYPDYADKIAEDTSSGDDDGDAVGVYRRMIGILNGPQHRKVLVRYFYQKPTAFLASGRWIVSTRTALLENRALQPREEGLHLIRLTDIDIPGEQRGQSFFTQGKTLNAAINDLTSMSMRNQKMMSFPKWIVPKGSVVRKDALGNDISTVEFSGPTPPQILTPPTMNQENMAVKSGLKADMQQVLGTTPTDMGQVPANIRSATALQAMQEQDDMRSSSQNLKQATWTRELVEAMINLASAYYEPDDNRLIPVVGRDNRYLLKRFDPQVLTRGYTVRVANDNGLPTSKAVRFDMAMQMREAMPEYMTEERIADWLQWGDDGKILDAATKAQRAAEAENEAILSGEPTQPPAEFEQHLVHWTVHAKEFQDYSYKNDVPPEIQQQLEDHMLATEMLMMDAAWANPRFAVELVKIAQWPLFYNISDEDRVILDSARSGNPLGLVQMQQLKMMSSAPPMVAGGMAPPAGGFNAPTNGMQGPAGDNPAKVNTMALDKNSRDTMAPPKEEENPPPAAQQAPPSPIQN